MNHLQTCAEFRLFDSEYQTAFECRPRQTEKGLTVKQVSWKLENSLFKTSRQDDPELITKLFEYDWVNSKTKKIPKLRDEQEIIQLKGYLKDNYQLIKDSFRYLSSISPVNGIFSISSNVLVDFLQNIIDGRLLKLNDIDFHFVSTNATLDKEKTTRNPERQLIRHQFMEYLIRVAIDKYLRNGICSNVYDSFRMLFEEGLKEKMKKISLVQEWRRRRFWNCRTESVIKERLPFLKMIFNRLES